MVVDSGNKDSSVIIGGKINPSAEHIVSEYLEVRRKVDLLRERNKPVSDSFVLEHCERHLADIELALRKRPRRTFIAWKLIHRVGENLILLMTADELAAVGKKIIHDLKMSSLPDYVKTDWSTKVEDAIRQLDPPRETNLPDPKLQGENLPHPAEERRKKAAETLRIVKNIINDYVDDLFWDIWVRRALSAIYALSLAVCVVFLLPAFLNPESFLFTMRNILLLGAIGGLSSGLITAEQEHVSKGHFVIPFAYYAAIRPVLGALGAVVMFWLIQSQYLITVDPPVTDPSVFTKPLSENRVLQQDSAGFSLALSNISTQMRRNKSIRISQDDLVIMARSAGFVEAGVVGKRSAAGEGALMTLHTVPGKQHYLYLLLLLVGGFTGDKLLKYVSCRITGRLFAEAEKSREIKK
jgi:hypothetical protein